MGKRKRADGADSADCQLNSVDTRTIDEGEPSQKRLRRNSTSTAGDGDDPKTRRKRVRFDAVTLFYFERSQGFSCVPTHGGCTLGMSDNHHSVRRLSLSQHERELHDSRTGEKGQSSLVEEDADEESLEAEMTSSDEEEEDEAEELTEGDDVFFLQPLGSKQRKVMLKTAGVDDVSREEREELKQIRKSREVCGCQCRETCLPESCFCIINNIKCQVDRMSFPCGCTKSGCRNPVGRVEFNPIRVRSHYLTTMMRLKLEERRLSGLPPSIIESPSEVVTSPTHVRFFDDNSYCDESAQISQLPRNSASFSGASQPLSSYQQVQFRVAPQDCQPQFPRFESVFGLSGAMQTGRSYTLLSPQHPTVPQTSYAADGTYESGGNSYWSDGKFRSERNFESWKLANNSASESSQYFDASYPSYAQPAKSGENGANPESSDTSGSIEMSTEDNSVSDLNVAGDSLLVGAENGAEHPAELPSTHAGSCEDPGAELHNFHHFHLCEFGVDTSPLCFCCSFSPGRKESYPSSTLTHHLENPILYAAGGQPDLAAVTTNSNGSGEERRNGADLSDPLRTPTNSFEDSGELETFGRHKPKTDLKLILQGDNRVIQDGPDSSDISADSGFDEETDSVSSSEADFCPTFPIASLYPHIQQRTPQSSSNLYLSGDLVNSGQLESSMQLSEAGQSAIQLNCDGQLSHRSAGQLGTVLKESICETG